MTEPNTTDSRWSGVAVKGEEPVSLDAGFPTTTSEANPLGGSPPTGGHVTSTATPALAHEPPPKGTGFLTKIAKAFLLLVLACCLFLFLSFSASSSAKGHRIQVGFPSPWFEAEGSATGFNHHINLASWSWAVAALGALCCYFYGAIRRRETAQLSGLEKLGSRGCLLWFLIGLFAFIVVSIMAILMMTQERSSSDEAAATAARKDTERIQGTWAVISLEENGKKAPTKVVAAMAFKGDRVKVIRENDEQEGSFRLDPTQEPKTFDLLIEGLRTPGIYTLEADQLTICLQLSEHGKRPKRFATDSKSDGLRLMILKRQKP